jgi:ribonuclease PH
MPRETAVSTTRLRKVKITRKYTKFAPGSVLIEQGDTRVICTASVEKRVPPFVAETSGWLTAEYAMLPGCTPFRKSREVKQGKPDGRGVEISRLIGRCLRCAVDLEKMPGVTVTVDCDVIQADGGTRCASITGGMVALCDAFGWMKRQGLISESPLRHFLAAVSVGIVDGKPVLDLCYAQDSRAEVDMNVVMTEDARFVELQGTAEGEPFSEKQLSALRRLATNGIAQLIAAQKKCLEIK